jgi:hypothetical protein
MAVRMAHSGLSHSITNSTGPTVTPCFVKQGRGGSAQWVKSLVRHANQEGQNADEQEQRGAGDRADKEHEQIHADVEDELDLRRCFRADQHRETDYPVRLSWINHRTMSATAQTPMTARSAMITW